MAAHLWLQVLVLLYLAIYASSSGGPCPNACNFYGTCDGARCSCFVGWQGNDCSVRACPSGYAVADIASKKDTAHALEECSGRGSCERETGSCICDPGWSGSNCGKSFCMNGCSGRGQCLSLQQAGLTYDGYTYNHTTTYSLWDANMFWGCKCDAGYTGADCSQAQCESGLDPRRSQGTSHEVVTLVCVPSASTMGGKFKLNFMGQSTKTWLYPTSKAWEVAKALTVHFQNTSLHAFAPVIGYNRSADTPVCGTKVGEVRTTQIKFRRLAGDVPAVSFYANLITGGQMYFETLQTLICDCTGQACNGTFRVSFDGVMSNRLNTYQNGSAVVSALLAMATVKNAGIFGIYPFWNSTLSVYESTPICRPGYVTNHTYAFNAQAGNIPRIGLWSSVVGLRNPSIFTASNTTSTILSLKTHDGRDDNIKVCNGIGQCDYSTGQCVCPEGYGLDPDIGPCGKIVPKSSKFNGIGRCPGIVSVNGNNLDGTKTDFSEKYSHMPRIYISRNPIDVSARSSLVYYTWTNNPDQFPLIDQSTRTFMFYMTSSTSAGPLVYDQAKERLFFVDANPTRPFIGIASVGYPFNTSSVNVMDTKAPYKIWIYPTCAIFGLAFNANFNQRVLYWTCPGAKRTTDGSLYYAYIDDATGTRYNLGAAFANSLIDPMGIAFSYKDSKIFWLDLYSKKSSQNVLNSCNMDGSGFAQSFLPTTVMSHSLTNNLTDMVIDIAGNNSLYLIDMTLSTSNLIAVTLDKQFYNNVTNDANEFSVFQGMTSSRILSNSSSNNKFGKPRYMTIDDVNGIVIWSDSILKTISFTSRVQRDTYESNYTVIYSESDTMGTWPADPPAYPVGIELDPGLSQPNFDGYLDCYGNGKCLGAAGNFECQCFDGFSGDCKARVCPRGKSWFHQPFVDNIAHDVFAECSSVGVCDRHTGACSCQEGYEGAACERLMCPGQTDSAHHCSGNGRCMSLRMLALKRKDTMMDITAISYGAWDADMIFGCSGDEYGFYPGTVTNITGYGGPKGDQRECPFGFNSRESEIISSNRTLNLLMYDANMTAPAYQQEVQEFACSATGGSFALKFRGATTSTIPSTASSLALESALASLPTVGNVIVTFATTSASSICSSTGVTGNITFTAVLGATPLLKTATSSLTVTVNGVTSTGQITFLRRIAGKGTLYECSGHGQCDRSTGECQCYPGYGSSDGYGHFGIRGDCGRSTVL